ncbi:peptidyl-prolyl cis-trans isomerase [Balneolales bacterium ANBcel1]|nr:peptidyl-prolyl cis-trans isomerase [Balneolales bacterium ANBcel1]
MTDSLRFILILAIALFLASCEHHVRDAHDVLLAEVGNEVLTLGDIRNNVSPELFAQDSISAIQEYRNNWIRRQLKIREARRLGLHEQEAVEQRIRRAQETILVDAYNEAVFLDLKDSPVTRSEAQTYYESNKEKFVLAERHVRFRHMMTNTLNEAQNARNALQRGQSWRNVTETYSVNPRQTYRHSTRFFAISDAARGYEPLNNFLQVIGVTEISPIRRIGDHFHFVQLMETRDAGEHPEMEWVINQITEWLEIDRKRKQLRALEENLFLQAQANNEIVIYDIRTPNREIDIVTDSL